MSNIPIPDIITGGILLFFALTGIKNGLIKEIGKIAALVVGFILANQFSAIASDTLFTWIPDDTARKLTGYLTIFFLAAIIVAFIARILHKAFEIMLLGWFNRLLGFLLGLLKGFLLIGLVIFILETIPASNKLHTRMVNETYIYATCNGLKNIIIDYSSYGNTINQFQQSIKQKTDTQNLDNLKKYLDQ